MKVEVGSTQPCSSRPWDEVAWSGRPGGPPLAWNLTPLKPPSTVNPAVELMMFCATSNERLSMDSDLDLVPLAWYKTLILSIDWPWKTNQLVTLTLFRLSHLFLLGWHPFTTNCSARSVDPSDRFGLRRWWRLRLVTRSTVGAQQVSHPTRRWSKWGTARCCPSGSRYSFERRGPCKGSKQSCVGPSLTSCFPFLSYPSRFFSHLKSSLFGH